MPLTREQEKALLERPDVKKFIEDAISGGTWAVGRIPKEVVLEGSLRHTDMVDEDEIEGKAVDALAKLEEMGGTLDSDASVMININRGSEALVKADEEGNVYCAYPSKDADDAWEDVDRWAQEELGLTDEEAEVVATEAGNSYLWPDFGPGHWE